MALKTKQRDLKAVIAKQKEDMAMKCAECMGFFVDGYEVCTSTACPLRPFFPTSTYISRDSFVEKMRKKAEELGNDKTFVGRIGSRRDLSPQRPKTVRKG